MYSFRKMLSQTPIGQLFSCDTAPKLWLFNVFLPSFMSEKEQINMGVFFLSSWWLCLIILCKSSLKASNHFGVLQCVMLLKEKKSIHL